MLILEVSKHRRDYMIEAFKINTVLESIKIPLCQADSQPLFNSLLKEGLSDYNVYLRTFRKIVKEPNVNYYIGGMYNSLTDRIHLQFTLPRENKCLTIGSKSEWIQFKFLFSQTLQHEIIHRSQALFRENEEFNFQPSDLKSQETEIFTAEENKEYLSDKDEIDAYGHDIALEILYRYKFLNPIEVLKNIDKYKKVWAYRYYKDTFKDNPSEWCSIKNRLLKKTFLWLPYSTVYF